MRPWASLLMAGTDGVGTGCTAVQADRRAKDRISRVLMLRGGGICLADSELVIDRLQTTIEGYFNCPDRLFNSNHCIARNVVSAF